jgi:hypothetical protein
VTAAAAAIINSIIIIIIIIIGKDTISFMQGIYTYIPETNHVPKEYNVAAILTLLFMAPISLVPMLSLMYFYISPIIIIIIMLLLLLLLLLLLSLVTGFLPGTSLESAVTPTAQVSSFTLQYFP